MRTLASSLVGAFLLAGVSFPSPVGAQEPRGISGKWAGVGVNNHGGKGTASLIVRELPDGTLAGKWGRPVPK
jgi:hypothetical protein